MTEREQLEQAIAALEAQRAILGDAVVDIALAPLRQKLAALDAPASAGQRKQATILFADVSGFTAMSETMDAEEVRDMMNAVWQRLDGAILRHGGTIDKHIGDAVMALWGAQAAREDDPERTIHAALDMQAALNEFVAQQNRAAPGAAAGNLRMRIGINTGPVLLGSVGTTGEFTAMGDTVNLASRLEHAAPVGGVLISHDTYRHVRGVFDVLPQEPLTVKGKAEPVHTYVVQRAKPRAFRLGTRGVEGVETRMIGREAELAELQQALQAAAAQRAMRALTVIGEAGVGKSRLLYEFNNWLELQPPGFQVLRGRATEEMSGRPYALLRDILSFHFGIQDSDRAAVAREKIERGVSALMGSEALEKAHFIGHLIGLDFLETGSPYLEGVRDDTRQIRARAFRYIAQLLLALTLTPETTGPTVVLLVEDAHWADDGSLDWIEFLLGEGQEIPLLILSIARPALLERRPGWGQAGGAAHRRLHLEPLSAGNSQLLVQEILRQVSDIPPALQALIVGRAEGNPLYVEELIKILIEDGAIVPGADRWTVKPERLSEGRIPPTLTGIIQARLDNLPQTEREVLQQASVVGRVYWDEAVTRLQRAAAEGRAERHAGLAECLGELQAKEMIFRRGNSVFDGAEEYIFKHTLLHEVTYESVLKRWRRAYHAQVAAWLMERSGERVSEYAGLIGEHFEHAGEMEQAAEWYARAGRQAQDTYAPGAAVDYYRKTLSLWPAQPAAGLTPARRAAVLDGLGEMLRWQARFAEAVETYNQLRAESEASGDRVMQARAWLGLAHAQETSGDYRTALESVSQTERIAMSVTDPDDPAYAACQAQLPPALYRKGVLTFRLGDAQAALELAGRALDLASQLGARTEMARSLFLLGVIHNKLSLPERAAEYGNRALELFREMGNRFGMGAVLDDLGENARVRQDYTAAVAYYQEALAIAREIGLRDGEMSSLNNLGGARVELKDFAAAEADLRQVIRLAQASGWGYLSQTYRYLVRACLGQGKTDEAVEAARQALAMGQKSGSREDIARAWHALGLALGEDNRRLAEAPGADGPLDAATCFARGVELLAEINLLKQQAQALRDWARHDLRWGARPEAEKLWARANEIYAQLGMGEEAARPLPA